MSEDQHQFHHPQHSGHRLQYSFIHRYTQEEMAVITKKLETKLEADAISYRTSGPGGQNVAYVEGWRIMSIANDIFGFNGWNSQILSITTDFLDIDTQGRVNTGITCMVRVNLKDGTYREDIGYGMAENQRSKAAALEKAKKESVTDAIKRALRQFGDRLGNCTYDKVYLRDVKQQLQASNNSRVQGHANQVQPTNQLHPVTNHNTIVHPNKENSFNRPGLINNSSANINNKMPPIKPPAPFSSNNTYTTTNNAPVPSDAELLQIYSPTSTATIHNELSRNFY